MRRTYYHGPNAYSFGQGLMTPAVKALIWANVAVFLLTAISPSVLTWFVNLFGLMPARVVTQLWIWQPFTYLFLHGDVGHILINMLILWMFGVQLERLWGSRFFLRYYFVTGGGAGLCTIAAGLLPFSFADPTWNQNCCMNMGARLSCRMKTVIPLAVV